MAKKKEKSPLPNLEEACVNCPTCGYLVRKEDLPITQTDIDKQWKEVMEDNDILNEALDLTVIYIVRSKGFLGLEEEEEKLLIKDYKETYINWATTRLHKEGKL